MLSEECVDPNITCTIVCTLNLLDTSPTCAENCFLEASVPKDTLKHMAGTKHRLLKRWNAWRDDYLADSCLQRGIIKNRKGWLEVLETE